MTLSNSHRIGSLLGIVALMGTSAMAATTASAIDVSVSLSTHEAYVGMPITAYVRIGNASRFEEPTLPDIPNADIRSTGAASRSSQTTIINGRRTDRTSVTYTWHITPRQPGSFEFPSLAVDADGQVHETPAIRFVATKSETGDLLFVEVDGGRDKLYVGQPRTLTLRIWLKPYHDRDVDVTLSATDMWSLVSKDPSDWGVFETRLQELADARQSVAGREVLREDGEGVERSYYLYELRATLYPKRPGRIDPGNVQIVARYPTSLTRSRDFFSRGQLAIGSVRPLVAEAAVAPIDVTPIPTAGRPDDYRGAVGHYEIVTRAVPTEVAEGDPITLHIGIRGDGPMDLVQAPPLAKLSALTDDFKVPDESLAGFVEDDVKVFRVTIRPRRSGITQIPSIPLSYFDPALEQFVTTRSESIEIHVTPAEHLSLASIGLSRAARPTGDNDDSSANRSIDALALENHRGLSVIQSQSDRAAWPWIFGWLLPPLFAGLMLAARHRQTIAQQLAQTKKAIGRRAVKGLENATTLDAISTYLLRYVAERLGRTPGSLTRADAVGLLRQHNVDTRELDQILATCDAYRFGPGTTNGISRLKTQAKTWIHTVQRLRILGNERTEWRPMRTGAMCMKKMATIASVSLVAMGVLLARPGSVAAAELSTVQAEQILAEATEAYDRGRVTGETDPVLAKEAFETAATKYQTLVNDGIDNGKLYFNLANAYLHRGDLGRALANYERATLRTPDDPKIAANLRHVRSLLPAAVGTVPTSRWERIIAWHDGLSRRVRLEGTWIGWCLLWLAASGAIYFRSRRWWLLAGPAALVVLSGTASLGLDLLKPPAPERAIVVTENTVLREGNGTMFAAASGNPLAVGSELEVRSRRGDWVEVETPNAQPGWIRTDEVECVPSV